MSLRPCLDCGALSDQSRCKRHRGRPERERRVRRARTEPWQAWYSWPSYRSAVRAARARAGGRCEVELEAGRCPNPCTQAHHTKPARLCTAEEFVDPTTLLMVCDRCHPPMESLARSIWPPGGSGSNL